jgi:hypothetical protein
MLPARSGLLAKLSATPSGSKQQHTKRILVYLTLLMLILKVVRFISIRSFSLLATEHVHAPYIS